MLPGLLELIREWISGYPASSARLLSMVGIKVHWLILQYVLGLPLLAVVAEALSAEAVNTLANLPGAYVVTGTLLAPSSQQSQSCSTLC